MCQGYLAFIYMDAVAPFNYFIHEADVNVFTVLTNPTKIQEKKQDFLTSIQEFLKIN